MLPKSKRISRADFPSKRGNRAVFSWGTVEIFHKLRVSGAVVASKKNFKTSVERHKVKRKVQVALSRFFTENPPLGAVVVYPNKKALSMTPHAIEKELVEKLARAG